MTIEDWRGEIDAIDEEVLRLLNRRAQIAIEVGRLKREAGLPLSDPERERDVLSHVRQANAGPLDAQAVAKLFRAIIRESRRVAVRATKAAKAQVAGEVAMSEREHTVRVAFQGERGAFSEEAAVKLLGEKIQLVPRPTFEALFAAVDEGAADYALAPIENSLVGSVHRSYDLLLESTLRIAAEIILPITHHLIAPPGASFEGIEVVESHPVALAQCERFFGEHPWLKRMASEDTAGSVREVVRRGDPRRAAIAGKRAAEIYGGAILREHLEDDCENYTRFLLLARSPSLPERANKLSLVVQLAHRPGSLYRALEPFARRDINLLKIESRPVKGRPWQYRFYLDLCASTRDSEVAAALAELQERAEEVRHLGCYVAAPAIARATERNQQEKLGGQRSNHDCGDGRRLN